MTTAHSSLGRISTLSMLLLAGTTTALATGPNPQPLDPGRVLDRLAIVDADAQADQARLVQLGEHGVLFWDQRDTTNGRSIERYAVLDAAGRLVRTGASPTTIELVAGTFDPVNTTPPHNAELDTDRAVGLSIVQIASPTTDAVYSAIADAGGTIVGTLPGGALVVRTPAETAHAIADLGFVRWVGDYRVSYRLEAPLVAELTAALDSGSLAAVPTRRYSILLSKRGGQAQQRVLDRAEPLGGVAELLATRSRRIELTLNATALLEIAAMDEVLYIDRWTPIENDVDIARELTGANDIEAFLGMTGQGVRAEVADGGVRATHDDFQNSPILFHTSNTTDTGHGTSTYGLVFGDGASLGAARGLLPDAQGIFASYSNLGDRFNHTAQLLSPPYEAVFQSNSWGGGRTFVYTTVSAEMDDIIFSLDFTILQSQSNAGTQDSRPQAWAKNIVSIGGVQHFNTLSQADDRWSFSASTGPARDGRIKPDLIHFYDSTITTSSSSDTAHANFGGTSGATPLVAGHFGLMYQMWAAGTFGNAVSGGSVFDERPHAATAKALMINTARPTSFTQVAQDAGRFRQGWGLPDLRALYDARAAMFIINETHILNPMDTSASIVTVDPGTPTLHATLVYHDPMANPAAIPAIVNDLTLRVTSPAGQTYWGNAGLLTGNESTTDAAPDHTNTVENVIVSNPQPGAWLVEVIADAINADGRPETPALDADFALVVSGVDPQASGDLVVRLGDQLPTRLEPGVASDLAIEVRAASQPDQVEAMVALGGGSFQAVPIVLDSTTGLVHRYTMSLPAASCSAASVSFFVRADLGALSTHLPGGAPLDGAHTIDIFDEVVVIDEPFQTSGGWTVSNSGVSDGAWAWGTPSFGGVRGEPADDFDGNARCWLTGITSATADLDGGPTRLTSPTLDLSGRNDPYIAYATFLNSSDASGSGEDVMLVEISNNNGATWTPLETVRSSFAWRRAEFRVADTIAPTATMRLRLSVQDNPNNSVAEAGFDAFRVVDRFCTSVCAADLSGSSDPNSPAFGVPDGLVDANDFFYYLDRFAAGDLPVADLTGSSDPNNPAFGIPDGILDANDFFFYLTLFAQGCP